MSNSINVSWPGVDPKAMKSRAAARGMAETGVPWSVSEYLRRAEEMYHADGHANGSAVEGLPVSDDGGALRVQRRVGGPPHVRGRAPARGPIVQPPGGVRGLPPHLGEERSVEGASATDPTQSGERGRRGDA